MGGEITLIPGLYLPFIRLRFSLSLFLGAYDLREASISMQINQWPARDF
jgi:hypothetical protein